MHNNEIGYPKEHLFLHLVKERGFKKVAEIGVASGNLTRRVLSSADAVSVYYAVDPWKVYIDQYDREPHEHEKQQSYWDSMYEKVVKIGEDFSQLQIMRMTSVGAAKELIKKKEWLDCVYIDSIHDVENIVKDVYCWLTLVREGGVLSGHDYSRRFAPMCAVLEEIFEKDLNYILMDPLKPALSYKNTYQGGNWWVDVKGYDWKVNLIHKIKDMFSETVASVEEEWKSGI